MKHLIITVLTTATLLSATSVLAIQPPVVEGAKAPVSVTMTGAGTKITLPFKKCVDMSPGNYRVRMDAIKGYRLVWLPLDTRSQVCNNGAGINGWNYTIHSAR